MNKGWMALTLAGSLAVPAVALADVNCNQVNKYLQMGRTAQDVSETMVISLDEVKKCQSQAGSAQGGSAPAGGAAGASGAAGAGGASATGGASAQSGAPK